MDGLLAFSVPPWKSAAIPSPFVPSFGFYWIFLSSLSAFLILSLSVARQFAAVRPRTVVVDGGRAQQRRQ